jgi:hypothetical protein
VPVDISPSQLQVGVLSGQAAKQERGLANAIEAQCVILPGNRTDIRHLGPELTVPLPRIVDAPRPWNALAPQLEVYLLIVQSDFLIDDTLLRCSPLPNGMMGGWMGGAGHPSGDTAGYISRLR